MRAELLKLKNAFTFLGVESTEQLENTAKGAVLSFELVRRSGRETARNLREVWVEGVVPKLIAAYGKIPAEFAAIHAQIVGEAASLSEAYTVVYGDMGYRLKEAADKGIRALVLLRRQGLISAEDFSDMWQDSISQIVQSFGKIPEAYRGVVEEVTGLTKELYEDFVTLGEMPPKLAKDAVDAQVEAFIHLRDAGKLTLTMQRELWKDIWQSILDTYEDENIPAVWEGLYNQLIAQTEALKEAEKLVQKETVEGIKEKYQRLRTLFTTIEDDELRLRALTAAVEKEKAEINKHYLGERKERFETLLTDIQAMDEADVTRKRTLLREALEAMEEYGMEGTAIYKRMMTALRLLNEGWRRSFMEILEDNLKQFENNFASAIANIAMAEDDQDRESLALFKARQEDRRKDLRERLTEGKMGYQRYALEIEQINKELTQRESEEQSKFVRLFKTGLDEMKRVFIKTTAEILANWIATQIRMKALDYISKIMKKDVGEDEEGAEGGEGKLDMKGLIGSIAGLAITAIIGKILPFQKGGLVKEPTIGLLAERKPEVVIPLEKLQEGAAPGLSKPASKTVEVHLHDTWDMSGAMVMLDDTAAIDRAYEKYWLPSRRRYAERIKDVVNEELL